MTNVFFLYHHPRFSYDGAKDFGDVVYLFAEPRALPPLAAEKCVGRIQRALARANYVAGEDFIGLTGDSRLLAYLALAIPPEQVRFLVYDVVESTFVERKVNNAIRASGA